MWMSEGWTQMSPSLACGASVETLRHERVGGEGLGQMGPTNEHAHWSAGSCLTSSGPASARSGGLEPVRGGALQNCWWGVGGGVSGLLEGWAGSNAKAFRNRDSNPGLSGESRVS